jgi:hypothetical protein
MLPATACARSTSCHHRRNELAMSRTISTTATAEVAADPTAVWTYVSDLHRYAEWVHGTLEVLDADPMAQPGAAYAERNRVVGPITARSNWTVAEVDIAQGFQRHESDGMPGVPMFSVLIWVERGPAGARVTLTLEAQVDAGPLTGLIARMFEASLRRSNETSVASLRSVLETGIDGGLRREPHRSV